MKKRKYKW